MKICPPPHPLASTIELQTIAALQSVYSKPKSTNCAQLKKNTLQNPSKEVNNYNAKNKLEEVICTVAHDSKAHHGGDADGRRKYQSRDIRPEQLRGSFSG